MSTLVLPVRRWRVTGLWEMFRIDHAEVLARTEKEARDKFRRRYRNRRSVTNVRAELAGETGGAS